MARKIAGSNGVEGTRRKFDTKLFQRKSKEKSKETLALSEQTLDYSSYSPLLRLCGKEKDLLEGKRIHDHMNQSEFGRNMFLTSLLVEMYGKCGAVEDAYALFARMDERKALSWNFMIRTYAWHGQGRDALRLFEQMQQEGVTPDQFTFVGVLSACCSPEAMAEGQLIHARIIINGFESDVVVGTALVSMYGKWASIRDARLMFDEMPERNVISWNSMVAAYANNGHYVETLKLFEEMEQQGAIPNKATFVSVVDACSNEIALIDGESIHNHIVNYGYESDVIVGTALVNMYGKCGRLLDAQRMFEKLPQPNVVSWNAIIGSYIQHGQFGEALKLFQQMQQREVVPNKATFVSLLSACANLEEVAEGKLIHNLIRQSGLTSDVVVGNALIHMYGKCGSLDVAWTVFERMPQRNVISWTTMIAVHAQHAKGKEALQIYAQMLQEKVIPNMVTFVSILDACTDLSAIAEGKQVHSCIVECGVELDIGVGTALVNMYGKCCSMDEAQTMFDKLPKQNLLLWNVIIAAYTAHGQSKKSLHFFNQMQLEGEIMNTATIANIFDACASLPGLAEGKRMHARTSGRQDELDEVSGTALVNMYGKCGRLEDARSVFDNLAKGDTILWTAMIAAYAQHQHSQEALQLFDQMQYERIKPDKVTFVSVLDACASLAALVQGQQVHSYIVDWGLGSDIVVGTALVNMYSKCGSLAHAREVFDNMLERNVISWSAMIASYAQHGRGKDAFELFYQMCKEGIMPNCITFTNIFSACSHSGLVDEACLWLVWMKRDHCIMPTVDHYCCIIDLLGRTGRLDEAEDLIKEMPYNCTALPWMTLLGACTQQIDVERGERAARHVFALDPEDVAPYVLLSNIYSAVGREDKAAELLNRVKDRSCKQPKSI